MMVSLFSSNLFVSVMRYAFFLFYIFSIFMDNLSEILYCCSLTDGNCREKFLFPVQRVHLFDKKPQARAGQEEKGSSVYCQAFKDLEEPGQSGEKSQGQKGCGYVEFIESRFIFHKVYLP